MLALCVVGATMLLAAERPAISSDESLYLSEAVSIATGHGPTYTTGEPVVHRAYLFPALLATEVKAFGADSAAVYLLSRVAAVAAACALGLFVARNFGGVPGIAASSLALASAFVDRLGNSLYVDVTESLFVLLALIALSGSTHRSSIRAFAAAGALVAAAFWTKESALLLTPLPFVLLAATRPHITRRDVVALACYTLAVGVPLGAWWLWVAHYTRSTYLAGAIGVWPAYVLAAAPLVAAALLFAFATRLRRPIEAPALRVVLAAAFVLGWNALWVWGLERHSWPHSHDYLVAVPQYVWHVGPSVQPFFLLLPAWSYVAWRAIRGDETHSRIAWTAALFLPFFIFTANRQLDLRDSLPLVYLSFAAIAVAIFEGARWVAARFPATRNSSWAAPLAAAAIALAAVPQLARNHRTGLSPAEVSGGADWNAPVARGTAHWLETNVPAGETVMSSRLYYSSIFTLTNGRYPVVQVPTLRVQFDGPRLRPMSTQFRWEDQQLSRYGRGSWLYLRRYPQKGYFIGLTQDDVLNDVRSREARYLILTGEDAGFSSLSYLDYFLGAPGFRLVHVESGGASDAAYIFAVDARALAPRPFPLTLDAETAAALRGDLGADFDASIGALAPSVRISDSEMAP